MTAVNLWGGLQLAVGERMVAFAAVVAEGWKEGVVGSIF